MGHITIYNVLWKRGVICYGAFFLVCEELFVDFMIVFVDYERVTLLMINDVLYNNNWEKKLGLGN